MSLEEEKVQNSMAEVAMKPKGKSVELAPTMTNILVE